ncbi:MAG TPA: hypothetical protein VK983_04150 [Candidatus Limnocylindrales bacterium]|nr:hypothetical protein [Candidatus Limnocylindrales bacterium]
MSQAAPVYHVDADEIIKNTAEHAVQYGGGCGYVPEDDVLLEDVSEAAMLFGLVRQVHRYRQL